LLFSFFCMRAFQGLWVRELLSTSKRMQTGPDVACPRSCSVCGWSQGPTQASPRAPRREAGAAEFETVSRAGG
jgi:hypothetical protein